MFNLEQSIADWRRQMLAAGIKTPVPLEELEIHLREEIERQLKVGMNGSEALHSSIGKIGPAGALKLEFKKNSTPMRTRLVKLTGLACGATAGLFSLWLLYNLLFLHEVNMPSRILGLMAVTLTVLSWRYGHGFLPNIGNPHARTAIAVACCVAGVGVIVLFIKILPHFFDVPAGADLPISQLLVSFLWAWTVMAVLGAVAYGIEDAADKNTGHHA